MLCRRLCSKFVVLYALQVNQRLPVSFGRDTKSRSFYLVSMPGEIEDPTQGVNV